MGPLSNNILSYIKRNQPVAIEDIWTGFSDVSEEKISYVVDSLCWQGDLKKEKVLRRKIYFTDKNKSFNIINALGDDIVKCANDLDSLLTHEFNIIQNITESTKLKPGIIRIITKKLIRERRLGCLPSLSIKNKEITVVHAIEKENDIQLLKLKIRNYLEKEKVGSASLLARKLNFNPESVFWVLRHLVLIGNLNQYGEFKGIHYFIPSFSANVPKLIKYEKEKNILNEWDVFFRKLSKKLDLPKEIRVEARRLLSKVRKKKIVGSNKIAALACFYASAKRSNPAYTVQDILAGHATGNEQRRTLNFYRKMIRKKIVLTRIYESPKDHVSLLVKRLDFAENDKRMLIERSYKILSACPAPYTRRGHPRGIACAVLYLAGKLESIRLLQWQLAGIGNITEVTLRNRCKEIIPFLKKILNESAFEFIKSRG